MVIRLANENDLIRCAEIAAGLSDWFDSNEIEEIKKKICINPTYVSEIDGVVLGFICVKEKYTTTMEMEYMGVDINCRHKGIGKSLIDYVETELAQGKIIMLKTLDACSKYEPYIQTRAFYERNGFVKIDTISPYPGWSDDCPCAIYVKVPKCIY